MAEPNKTGREVLYTALAEYIKGQNAERKTKKWRWGALIALVALNFVFNIAYSLATNPHHAKTANYAAVVRIDGQIGVGRMASTEVLAPVLDEAFSDAKASCVALVINSPGGMVAQSQLIHDAITKLAKEKGKKVIAVAEDMMASGGYMIASAAQRIYAPQTAVVGSIGVISQGYDFTGLAEKLGVKNRTFTAGTMKDPFNPLEKLTPEAELKARTTLGELHGIFIQMVKDSRGQRLKAPDAELFDGEYWTGLTGAKLGLTDGYLDLQDAIKQDCGADSAVTYEPHLQVGDYLSFLTNR
jgi:signal peptide peptidase SppA